MTTPVSVASVLGDISHFAAFLIVIVSIYRKQSSQGWSGRMQILILISFATRIWRNIDEAQSIYQICIKVVWIVLSSWILLLVYWQYRKTYEKRCDTFWIESVILTSLASAFVFCGNNNVCEPDWIGWEFSHFCEALAILPQIYFVWIKCCLKELIVTYYVTLLVFYKGLYMVHWQILYLSGYQVTSALVTTGVIQLLLYACYYLMPNYKAAAAEVEEGEVGNTGTFRRCLPSYLTGDSLLESPLLKKSNSAIFIVSDNVSDTSSLHRSISNSSSDDGRF